MLNVSRLVAGKIELAVGPRAAVALQAVLVPDRLDG
jgi:hypothetical protein